MNRWLQLFLGLLLGLLVSFCAGKIAIADTSSALDWFRAGVESTRRENYHQALEAFSRAIQLNSRFGAAYSNRCTIHLYLNKNDKASTDCYLATQYSPDNPEAFLNLGLAHYRLGNHQQALVAYQTAIARAPQDFRIYYNQGLAYFALGDYDRAIQNYDLALALAATVPGDRKGEIYLDRGLSYLMQEEVGAAIVDFTQAIAWQKNSDRAYYNRACAYSRGGGLREAIADFTQALAINPNLSEAYVNRGFLRHQLGWERGALEDLAIASRQFQQQGNPDAAKQINVAIEQIQSRLAKANSSQFA